MRANKALLAACALVFLGGAACKSNRAPDVPAPAGNPTYLSRDNIYTFRAVVTDPNGDHVAARFDWGDSTVSAWTSLAPSGETVAASHAWHDTGTFHVSIQAADEGEKRSGWTDPFAVQVVLRRAPDMPKGIVGPNRGGQDTWYTFSTSASHPDGITVAIRFAWGGGDTSDWSAFVAPGETVTMEHQWTTPDTYDVTAQARDTGGGRSYWTLPHNIVIKPRDTLRLWRVPVADTGAASQTFMVSSPAIGADGTIYVGSSDSCLYAVNSAGSIRWSYRTGGAIQPSPAIASDGTVYVGSYDHSLYAISADGTLKWRYSTIYYIRSSPAIAADSTVYVGSDDYLYAFNPDGTLKWRYPTGGPIWSSPAIAADGTIYVGSNGDYLYAINPDGTLKWRYDVGNNFNRSSAAIGDDGTVYCGADEDNLAQSFYAFDQSGTLKWSYSTGADVRSAPAIAGDGTIYVGADHYLSALNPDGTLRWRYMTSGHVRYSSPAVAADGTIYAGADGLYALNADGTLRWKYELDPDYGVSSSPTIGADGTVYFTSDDGYLYALKGTSPLASSPWPKFHHDVRNTGRTDEGPWSRLRMVGSPQVAPGNDGFMIEVVNEGTVDATVSWLEFYDTPDSAYMRDFFINSDKAGYPIPDGQPGTGPGDTVHFTVPVTIAPYGAQMAEIAFLDFRAQEIYPPGVPADVRGKTFVFRFSDGSVVTVNP